MILVSSSASEETTAKFQYIICRLIVKTFTGKNCNGLFKSQSQTNVSNNFPQWNSFYPNRIIIYNVLRRGLKEKVKTCRPKFTAISFSKI